ncbi:hypothetical protein PGB90_000712 [Kerria lacca]
MKSLSANTNDITSSLSNNLAAINLNVNLQPSPLKKTIRSDIIASNIEDSFLNTNVNGDSRLPLYAKNTSLIQEFIPRNKIGIQNDESVSKNSEKEITISNKKSTTTCTFQDLSVASVPEFIPRGISTRTYQKNINDPEISEIHHRDSPPLNNELVNYSNHSTDNELQTATNVTTYQENVNGTVYFYTAPLNQSTNTSPVEGLSSPPTLISDPVDVPLISGSTMVTQDGVNPLSLTQPLLSDPVAPVFYIQDGLNPELILMQQTSMYSEIPEKVGENYINIEPLEPLPAVPSSVLKGYVTSTYKANHVKTGTSYFLRRIHGVSLPSTKCNALVNNWKKPNHTNLVHLKEMIVSRDFGDNSLVFVYDYYPDSETLLARHFASQAEGFNDTFSSDPNAPRPYSHTKNALLRQQHSNAMLPESILWSYAIQLTGALKVIHAAGLSCRCVDPSKVIITNRNRVRLSGVCVFDVILYDHSPANRLQLTSHFQQEDLSELGKLLLALACGSLIAIQKENLQTSLEVMSRTYSTDIRNLIAYLLHSSQRRSILELMPMIGARFYSQIDAMQLQCDILETEIRKETDYRRLLKLLIKLVCLNEWPDLSVDQPWTETSDRYMLTLFRDYLFHQMSEDRRPWMDINQIIHSLTKLMVGSTEKVRFHTIDFEPICLVPQNEESVLVMSYEDIKQCFERSYSQLSEIAAYVTEDSVDKGSTTQDI